MGASFESAVTAIDKASAVLFDADPLVRSVGVGSNGDGFGFVAVRNVNAPIAYAASRSAFQQPESIDGIRVHYLNSTADPSSLVQVPHTGPGSPGTAFVPEQQSQRPLVCGVQVQNFDDDVRTGAIGRGAMTVGTLGCFVRLASGSVAMLSNNHVLAGQNRGLKLQDRILQPGGPAFDFLQQAAILTDFVNLVTSPPGASIIGGTVRFNDVDAAVAELQPAEPYMQAYLPSRPALSPKGTAVARFGDRVHKVGRTTGLTWGVVTQVSVQVGPVSYGIGGCWFRQSIVVEGVSGTTFSQPGDSGSAIVRDVDGLVLGLLYAGNGVQTYACPLSSVLSALNCSLA